MSEKNKPTNEEIYREIYLALQAIISCPKGCKCCKEHDEAGLKALMGFLNRWRGDTTEFRD